MTYILVSESSTSVFPALPVWLWTPSRLPLPSMAVTTFSCPDRFHFLHCIFTQLHFVVALRNSPSVLGNDAGFHCISTDWVFRLLSVTLSLCAPLKTPPPLCPPPPFFFFLLLIGAGLNKERLKGKGKICFSVSALPSVIASTSWAERQAGRGRTLWSDFPCSFCLFFFLRTSFSYSNLS